MTAVSAQFHQLPMFMSAKEIQATHEPHPGDRDVSWDDNGDRHPEPESEFWNRKLDEARTPDRVSNHHLGTTLYDDVSKYGVLTPVALEDPAQVSSKPVGWDPDVHKPRVMGGHHRIAVMAATRPNDLMAVVHVGSVSEAHASERKSGGYN